MIVKQCTASICLLLLFTGILYAQPKKKLTRMEAVQLAEAFIAQNGYTDLLPMKNKSKLSLEHIEYESNVNEILKERHNTLERRAYGVARRGRFKQGWTVAFRYKEPCDAELLICGRAVTMDAYGEHLLVEHSDANLKIFRKIKRDSR